MNHDQGPKPSFYAVIPAHVRYCKELEMGARMLYGEITALCQQEGYCWATNQYFANLYDVDDRTIRRWVDSLKKEKFIAVEVEKKGIQVRRLIWISPEIQKMFTKGQKCPDPRTKMSGPPDKNVPHNNTSNTTTNQEPLYTPPTNCSAEADVLYNLFLQKIKERRDTFRDPNKSKWLKDFDALVRVDKRSIEEIKRLIEWIHANEFWSVACLSPLSLRKNFDQMSLQMEAEKTKGQIVAPKDNVAANKAFLKQAISRHPQSFKSPTPLGLDDRIGAVTHRTTGRKAAFESPPVEFRNELLGLLGLKYNPSEWEE